MTTKTTSPTHHTGASIFGLLCLGLLAMCVLSQRGASSDTATTAHPPLSQVRDDTMDWAYVCITASDSARDIAVTRDVGLRRDVAEAMILQGPPAPLRLAGKVRMLITFILDEVYTTYRYKSPNDVAQATQADCLRTHPGQ